jgi:hypothetical protein
MNTVKEASVCTVRARFFDGNDVPATPTSARWRLRDVTNDRLLQDWTPITVTSDTAQIVVPASLNAISNDRRRYQEHALSVQANVGETEQYTDEVRYKVQNLSAFK